MKKLSELFEVTYGNKFDLNKMQVAPNTDDGPVVNFVGRSSRNHGVSATVRPVEGVQPFHAGLITVALGGTKLLASFVQMCPFYTAQNVAVLKPLTPLSFTEKLFVCLSIRHNRFRYSAFGREANRTLRDLLVPEPAEFPTWVKAETSTSIVGLDAPSLSEALAGFDPTKWKWFAYDDLFTIERGRGPRRRDLNANGATPFITSTDSNNGLTGFTTVEPCHPKNTISVNRNGSVGEAFISLRHFAPLKTCTYSSPNLR